MSGVNKSGSNFYCDVCKLNIQTEAEFALHEFGKRHCDNLLRIAKNKPIITKQKSKSESANKEPSAPPPPAPPAPAPPQPQPQPPPQASLLPPPPSPKVANHSDVFGNFAKYGYFVPGEAYDATCGEVREFNAEYDPYLQKYAENPVKEPITAVAEEHRPRAESVANSRRKKKKKLKTCPICNVTLLTVPDYEAHMRSPQHSWNLKLSGMGVSAHFVKASTDVRAMEESAAAAGESEPATSGSCDAAFPQLYCDVCEILVYSEHQFHAHVTGKTHNENVARKAETRARKPAADAPNPNQLYCYSCKVALNNLYQYNEHKFGKRHKMRCKRLMKEGITIPPEERVSEWGAPKADPGRPVVYPEMYEKCMMETPRPGEGGGGGGDDENGQTDCETCALTFATAALHELHVKSEDHIRRANGDNRSRDNSNESDEPAAPYKVPRLVFHGEKNAADAVEDAYKCGTCSQTFAEMSQLDEHLTTEDHARRIVEPKKEEEEEGTPKTDVVEASYKDGAADENGTYACREHVHAAKHRDGVRAKKAAKRALVLHRRRVKQKYVASGPKRNEYDSWRRGKCDESDPRIGDADAAANDEEAYPRPLLSTPVSCPRSGAYSGSQELAHARKWSPWSEHNYRYGGSPFPAGPRPYRYQRSPNFNPPWLTYPPCYR